MHRTSRSGKPDDRGAAAVEFGLVAPLMLLLVLGIMDFGWMLLQANLVNNVARDATRVASLSGTYSEIEAMVDAELTSVGIDLADVTTQITCTNTVGSSCDGSQVSYDTNATSGSTVKVVVSYTHDWITPFGALCDTAGGESCVGDTILLARAATMVRE